MQDTFRYQNTPILWSDPINRLVFMPFMRNLGTTALAANSIAGNTTITLVSGHGASIGEEIIIAENGSGLAYIGTILNVSGDDITLDTPIDYDFTVSGAFILRGQTNIATANGSLSSPVKFLIRPPINAMWDVTRILFSLIDDSAMDDGKFGGISALTNGVVLRVNRSGLGNRIENIGNAKTNGELANAMFDFAYASKAPAGQYGARGRLTFSGPDKFGAVIRLDGGSDPTVSADALELLIQDDLTDLINMRVIAEGHIVD